MDIMLAHLLIKLTTYMFCISIIKFFCLSFLLFISSFIYLPSQTKLLLLLSMLIFGRQRGLGACDRDDLVINILTRGRDFASATAIQYS